MHAGCASVFEPAADNAKIAGVDQFASVLRAARAGAEWALTALYRELHAPLLRYIAAYAPHDAEDLASEVWIGVATGLERFDGDESAFRAWLFTIARRRLIDAQRRNGRRPTEPLPSGGFDDLAAPVDTETDGLTAIATQHALARIMALPRDQAEVVLLRVLAGLDADHVAAITGRRPGHVRVLQHRALRRLREELAPHCNALAAAGDWTS